ncbi:recombinase family protein [Erysipelothrix rhusiopathiae]|nr:recombinase family protein [Erysipelothrix rhusiopathiae]
MPEKKRNIAVYCRVSSDDQAENGYNLREQERRIDQYINAYSEEFTENVVKYIDDGYSAKDLKRKEMSMLLQDIKDDMISKVIIHNLDRLTRSMKDLIVLIELFEEHDVQLYSLREKIDTKTAIGRFFVSIIILIAQWEREAISERTIRALDQSAYEGNYVHGRAPFGYTLVNKKLVINEKEAAIIKQVYHMYLFDQDSINKIFHFHANHHNDFDFMWTYDRIKIILTNEIYTGTYRNKRIVIENHSPQIISHDLFNMVQKALKFRNRRNQHNYRYKLLCCDIKTGEILKHRSVVKKNGVYLYYQNQKQQRINQTIIDKQIPKFFDKYIDEIMRTELKSKISTLKRKDHRIKELDYYFETGLISMDYYINTKSSINEVIENKERELQIIANGFKKWNMMSSGQKRRFLLMHVEKILIDLNSKRVKKVIYKEIIDIS